MQEINKKNLGEFFDTDYSKSAFYLTFRNTSNYIDGLKPGGRKIIHTIKSEKINTDLKVNRLSAKVAESTAWIHGETSLEGAIVNMAQNYVGSNNIPLLKSAGTFGTRFIPSAAASRYIHTCSMPYFKNIFSNEDDPILINQTFENQPIEPRFFIPILPMILVNGSEGIGSGYAQKILPRDYKELIESIKKIIKGEKFNCPKPNYKGFTGKILKGQEPNSWEIHGIAKKDIKNTIIISEIPVGISLGQYLVKLDKLVEDKKIRKYRDKSEDDKFYFEITVDSDLYSKDIEEIKQLLGLIKKVTENFTCIDENNKIIVFKNPEELLKAYVDIRKKSYLSRKKCLIDKWTFDSQIALSKSIFIEKIVYGELKINNVPQQEIEKKLEKIKDIIKNNDSYDYLFVMPVRSFTKERIQELKDNAKETKNKVINIKKKKEEDLWNEDIENLKNLY
jgi:DNA topoisomerase-2